MATSGGAAAKPTLTFVTGNKKKLEEVSTGVRASHSISLRHANASRPHPPLYSTLTSISPFLSLTHPRAITIPPSPPAPLAQVTVILAAGASLPVTLVSQPLDLPELQGEPRDVAAAKARAAADAVGGPVIVEDTGLEFAALGGLPGPYIKWFLAKCGHDGLNRMLAGFEDKAADATCTFAFAAGPGADPVLFQGRTAGRVVPARGDNQFGWDPIFQPDEGGGLTYAEMEKADKNAISHRFRALARLRDALLAGQLM